MHLKSEQKPVTQGILWPCVLVQSPFLYLSVLLAISPGVIMSSESIFRAIFPDLDRVIYQQTSLYDLLVSHSVLVAISTLLSILVGVAFGILATRPASAQFRPLIEMIAAIGQTFPPVAVLAIAAPLTGFGATPAIIALVLYGLLPIIQATLTGLSSIPASVTQAATGLGMTAYQRFLHVEWPLALPVILSGIRTSTIINIGTTAIASSVGVQTLGSPIFIGLSGFNNAYVMQGAIIVGLLAITVDQAFEILQRKVITPR